MLLYSVLDQMLIRCEPEKETCVNLVSMTNRNHNQTVKNDIDGTIESVLPSISYSKPLSL